MKNVWPNLQTDRESEPGYVCLTRASGERLRPAAVSADGGVFAFHVPSAGLSSGERLQARLGGSPGATAPEASVPNRFVLLMSAAADGELRVAGLSAETRERIVGACLMHIVGSGLKRLCAHAASQAAPGAEMAVLVRPEDAYANVACEKPGSLVVKLAGRELTAKRVPVSGSSSCVLRGITLPDEGVHRLEVEDVSRGIRTVTNPIVCSSQSSARRLLWGMIHGHTELSDGLGSLDHYFAYMRDECGLDFAATGDHDHVFETSDHMWSLIQEAVASYNEPGRFTTFLGYEWAKWRRNGDGDRNVYYVHDGRPMYRSEDGIHPTPRDLFEALKDETALIIPHHTASIRNHCDWKDHEPEKERLVELYSAWGNSERSVHQGNPFPMQGQNGVDSGEMPAGFVQRALELGWRVGFTAGGDDHLAHPGDQLLHGPAPWRYRCGLLAVWARDNRRDAIWEALWNRRCYATTGARVIVDFAVNGWPMGSEPVLAENLELASARTVSATIHGTDRIERVEVVRNNQDVHCLRPDGPDFSFQWQDTEPLSNINLPPALHARVPFTFYYLRVTQADGEMAWASPIWIVSSH